MWTKAIRAQHSRDDLRFASDLTDAEWAVLEPLLQASRRSFPFVERAITNAGFSVEQATLAAGHFGAAARDEWTRIVSAGSAEAWGSA